MPFNISEGHYVRILGSSASVQYVRCHSHIQVDHPLGQREDPGWSGQPGPRNHSHQSRGQGHVCVPWPISGSVVRHSNDWTHRFESLCHTLCLQEGRGSSTRCTDWPIGVRESTLPTKLPTVAL